MFEGINRALVFLFEHKKIDEKQLRSLQNYYKSVVESNNFDLDSIKKELDMMFRDSNFINVLLSRVNSQNVQMFNNQSNMDNSVNNTSNQVLENEKKDAELTDVYDFRKDDHDYIKLTYSDGSVRVLENNLNNNGQPSKGEDIFSVLKEKYGEHDITRIFHEFTRNSIEVKLYDFNDLGNKNIYDQLSQNDKQLINIVMSQYPGKKVLSGAASNMFVVQEFGKPDILVKVESLNGIYQVRPIIGTTINEDESIDTTNDKSISLGHQKTLSTQIGRMFSDNRESGFMMLLLFIFLAGISSGIIFMIILNFIA